MQEVVSNGAALGAGAGLAAFGDDNWASVDGNDSSAVAGGPSADNTLALVEGNNLHANAGPVNQDVDIVVAP